MAFRRAGRAVVDDVPRVRSTLRASAQRFTLKNKKVVQKQSVKRQEWQDEAWGYFDDVPEVKYSVWFMGNVMSKVRLFVGVVNPDDPEADPVPISDPKSHVSPQVVAIARAELERLKGPLGALPEICRELNMNLEIAAECYLVGWGPRESADETDANGQRVIIPEQWDIRSVSEVEVTEGRVKVRDSPQDQSPRVLDPNNDTIIRIWQRHARWSMLADSNMRGVLGECEALVLLSNQVKAEAKSRMSGGYLTVPNELGFGPEDPTEGEDGEEAADDPLLQALYDGAVEPVEDPSAASAVAPTFVRGPAEFLKPEYFRHVTIGRETSAVLEERIQARVERLARGMNLPVETVLGHQSTTFSNAAQVAQDQFADHFYPRCVLIVDALTVAYMQPNLIDAGVDPDLVERLVVWFDPSAMIKQTDLSVTADKGHELGALSDSAWRRAMGWDDDDAPDAVERLLRSVFRLRSLDPGLTTGILELLGVPIDIPAVVPAGKVTAAAPDPMTVEGSTLSIDHVLLAAADRRRAGQPIDLRGLVLELLTVSGGTLAAQPALPAPAVARRNVGHDLMALDRELRSRLLVAADRQLARALDRAGNKLRAKSKTIQELVKGTNPRYVAATLGPALVASAGFSDDDLIPVGSFEQLGNQFTQWGEATQARALRLVAGVVAVSDSERADIELRQADELHGAWIWLRDELQSLALRRLYQPDAPVPDVGESDPTLSVPVGLIRQAIARAGGATGLSTGRAVRAAAKKGGNLVVGQDASVYVAVDNGAPLGGIGTGSTMTDVLADGSAGIDAFEWVYGPAFRAHPFEDHEVLDGEVFDSFTSETLAAGDWVGDFYFPGDHDGCNCDFAPIIVEPDAVSDSAEIFGDQEA